MDDRVRILEERLQKQEERSMHKLHSSPGDVARSEIQL